MPKSFRLPELIGLARSRLCRNMAIAVFTSIVLIEGAILIPSYRNYERDRLQSLDQAALTAVSTALAVGGAIDDAVGLAARVSAIVEVTPLITGLALYLPDGTLAVAAGEVDGLAPDTIGDGGPGPPARIVDTARRHDVLWPSGSVGAPYVAVARLDATSVSQELSAFLLRIAGLVLVITVFVSGVTMVIVGRHVVEPVLALRDSLSQAARDPARSSLFTLPADRNDELGEVFDAYNEMLDHVTNGIHQIAESKALAENLNRTLETRVRERTSELESAVEETRRASDALRQSEERFRRIFEESSDAVYVADLVTGEIIDANREASRKLGYGREDLIGMQLSAIHPGQMRKLKKHLARLSAGLRRPPILLPCRPKSGPNFVLELSAAVFVLDGRRLMLALGRDSEERTRVERTLTRAKTEAEAANRAKTAFLANMSHELRTPLNAIIGFSEIMSTELFGRLGNTRYTGYARDIVESATHLLNIINDILDISKAEAGQLDLAEDVVAPATIVQASCRLMDGLARRNGLVIGVEIDEDIAKVRVDARKLKQILVNLLSNAVKYAGEGGRVSVHVAMTPERKLSIVVADNGPGMAEDDIPIALATFGQVDARFDRTQDGTGLGLPLTKALTELHGGEFRLESTPGEGTRAIVLLPAERVLGRRRMRDSA